MVTPTTRAQHSRAGLRYGSDLTDAEWAVVEPYGLLRSAKYFLAVRRRSPHTASTDGANLDWNAEPLRNKASACSDADWWTVGSPVGRVGAPRVGSRETTVEASELVQVREAPHVVQHAEHKGGCMGGAGAGDCSNNAASCGFARNGFPRPPRFKGTSNKERRSPMLVRWQRWIP